MPLHDGRRDQQLYHLTLMVDPSRRDRGWSPERLFKDPRGLVGQALCLLTYWVDAIGASKATKSCQKDQTQWVQQWFTYRGAEGRSRCYSTIKAKRPVRREWQLPINNLVNAIIWQRMLDQQRAQSSSKWFFISEKEDHQADGQWRSESTADTSET